MRNLMINFAMFVSGVSVGLSVTVLMSSPDQVPSRPVRAQVITEDMPEWDCATMGNRVCGSTDSPVIYAP